MSLTPLDLVSWDWKKWRKVRKWMKTVMKLEKESWEEVCELHNIRVLQTGSRRISVY